MATETKQARQTAGNNATLAHLKRWLNTPLYRFCTEAMNEGGPDAVRAKLAIYVDSPESIETMMTTDPADWD